MVELRYPNIMTPCGISTSELYHKREKFNLEVTSPFMEEFLPQSFTIYRISSSEFRFDSILPPKFITNELTTSKFPLSKLRLRNFISSRNIIPPKFIAIYGISTSQFDCHPRISTFEPHTEFRLWNSTYVSNGIPNSKFRNNQYFWWNSLTTSSSPFWEEFRPHNFHSIFHRISIPQHSLHFRRDFYFVISHPFPVELRDRNFSSLLSARGMAKGGRLAWKITVIPQKLSITGDHRSWVQRVQAAPLGRRAVVGTQLCAAGRTAARIPRGGARPVSGKWGILLGGRLPAPSAVAGFAQVARPRHVARVYRGTRRLEFSDRLHTYTTPVDLSSPSRASWRG